MTRIDPNYVIVKHNCLWRSKYVSLKKGLQFDWEDFWVEFMGPTKSNGSSNDTKYNRRERHAEFTSH